MRDDLDHFNAELSAIKVVGEHSGAKSVPGMKSTQKITPR
jgi:hypothetical protein